jgi:signal transduction histidine kinase
MLEMLDIYKHKIRNSSKPELQISYSMDETLAGINLRGDARRLKQILGKLLDNAFKFTEKGYIEYGFKRHNDNKFLFYVKDSGIGIQPGKLKQIFGPFRQADEHLHEKQFGGTGLGLSIVKGLLVLMGGEIWVESTPDRGSIFYFTLPESGYE